MYATAACNQHGLAAGGSCTDFLPPRNFSHPLRVRESKAISRSFFYPPNPDAPVARPAKDIDARCEASDYPMRSCSIHQWRAVEALHGSQCDVPMWDAL